MAKLQQITEQWILENHLPFTMLEIVKDTNSSLLSVHIRKENGDCINLLREQIKSESYRIRHPHLTPILNECKIY